MFISSSHFFDYFLTFQLRVVGDELFIYFYPAVKIFLVDSPQISYNFFGMIELKLAFA